MKAHDHALSAPPLPELSARARRILARALLVLLIALPCIALAGFGLSGPQTLTNVLFGQVADEDELRSGVRREGAFFGVNALITKPAQSVAIALIPAILEAAHFVTRQSQGGAIVRDQPASAVMGIRMLVGLIPGIAMFAGALILALYPLRGRRLVEMKGKVLALHAEKRERLGEKGFAGKA